MLILLRRKIFSSVVNGLYYICSFQIVFGFLIATTLRGGALEDHAPEGVAGKQGVCDRHPMQLLTSRFDSRGRLRFRFASARRSVELAEFGVPNEHWKVAQSLSERASPSPLMLFATQPFN